MDVHSPPNSKRVPRETHDVPGKYGYAYLISYATAEKGTIVLPVTAKLVKLGVPYFLDTMEIHWGKNLHHVLFERPYPFLSAIYK